MSLRLFDFQAVDAAFMSTAERVMLLSEMGTGKTTSAIHAVRALYETGKNPFPVLVIAPNSVKHTWARELEAWWPGLAVEVVEGGAAKRRKQLEHPAHVYVMNWESIRLHTRLAPYGSISLRRCPSCGGEDERVTWNKCEVHPRELNEIDFRTVIADECHRSKNPQSKQTRALWAIGDRAEFKFALTGTPIANAPDDLWSILRFLDADEFPSRTRYVSRWCEQTFNVFGQPTVIGLKADTRDEFFQITNSRMRRMPKDLVLDFLPPKLTEVREVEMNPKQKKAYATMRDAMIAVLEDSAVVTTSPLAKLTRLMQFASSYAEVHTDPATGEDKVLLSDPSSKLDAFMGDWEGGDFGDEPLVVFAQSRQLIDMLSERLTKKGIEHGMITGGQTPEERQVSIDQFQSGKLPLILVTIAAGGVGLTLTRARIAVFLQRSWSNVDMEQAYARIHRIGSEKHESVLYVHYITPETVEEVQMHVIDHKKGLLEEIVRDAELMARFMKVTSEEDVDALEPEGAPA
jgi:SNF2 family DNA or RNA helicase